MIAAEKNGDMHGLFTKSIMCARIAAPLLYAAAESSDKTEVRKNVHQTVRCMVNPAIYKNVELAPNCNIYFTVTLKINNEDL